MALSAATTEIAVWMVNGIPARIVWDGVRYRVTDTPTPLQEEVWHPSLTHGARRLMGWRFQGTTSGGFSTMFEIAQAGEGWQLLRAYD